MIYNFDEHSIEYAQFHGSFLSRAQIYKTSIAPWQPKCLFSHEVHNHLLFCISTVMALRFAIMRSRRLHDGDDWALTLLTGASRGIKHSLKYLSTWNSAAYPIPPCLITYKHISNTSTEFPK